MVKVTLRMHLDSGDFVDIESARQDGSDAAVDVVETYWNTLSVLHAGPPDENDIDAQQLVIELDQKRPKRGDVN